MRQFGPVVMCALLFALPASADDPMAGMPPDIAAIIAKMKAGGRPTADDLAKLKAWQQGVISHVNAPTPPGAGSAAQADGIPCKVRVSLDYTATNGGSKETGHLEAYTDTTLYAVIAGDADYSKSVLNPDAKASSFRFMPILPKPGETKRPLIGGGVGNYDAHFGAGSLTVRGSLSRVAFGVMLTTTGQGDNLWASGAGITAELDGTEVAADPKKHTSTVHSDDGTSTVLGGLAAPWVDEQRHTFQMGQPTPAPAMKLSYKALADAVRSGKSSTVSGSEAFSFTRSDGKKVTGSASIAITLRPKPLELVIEPSDDTVFQKWVPQPDDTDDNTTYFGHQDRLSIHVALHDPAKTPAKVGVPTKAAADVGGVINVELADVTKYPGMTMNYPEKGTPRNDDPDLFFPKKQPDGIVWVDESHVHTASKTAIEATVWVAARDTAAYGKIQASIEDLGIISYDPRSKSGAMTLPLDENDNHIADGWEKLRDVAIWDKHAHEDWDDDAEPDGMANKGDGIVLIDEYRGFVHAEEGADAKFDRLTPKTKELFVMPVGPQTKLFKAGALKYGEVTHIKVMLTREEFADAWPKGKGLKKWINFNETPWSQQATAVRVEDRGTDVSVVGTPGSPAKTWFVDMDKTETGAAMTPQETEYIAVAYTNCERLGRVMRGAMLPEHPPADVVAAAARAHIDLDTARINSDPTKPPFSKLVNECVEFSTMHELGHATGANHHGIMKVIHEGAPESVYASGSVSCPMYYWQQQEDPLYGLEWLAGMWDPTQNAQDGHQWSFCTSNDNDWGHMRLK